MINTVITMLSSDEDVNWVYIPETGESVFEAPMIHAVWDRYEGAGTIFLGKPSSNYGGFKITGIVEGITALTQVEVIIKTVLADPDDIEIRDGIIFRRLDEMPFDKDGKHATGWEYLNACGTRWITEYEDI